MSRTPRSDREGEEVTTKDAGELGALAHAVARHARRKQALGRKVRATQPKVQEAKSAIARAPSAQERSSPAAQPRTPPPSRSPAPWVAADEKVVRERTAVRSAAVHGDAVTNAPAAPDPRRPATKKSAFPPARSAADVASQAAAAQDLTELRAAVAQCEACGLCKTRTQTVFMDGEGGRGVLFVGEAPGADEDRTGVPFVGRSGQLLTDIIEKGMGIPRREVHIANVLKCRPPENRDPTPEEKAICTPWLDRQIELLDPKVIVPLGRHAANHVLGTQAAMGALRKKVHDKGRRKVVPTFHPSYLLRSPGEKKECWKDIQLAMDVLGLRKKD